MNITFYNKEKSTTCAAHPDIALKLGSVLIKDLKIIDGMGEKTIVGYDGSFKNVAEIVDVTWKCNRKILSATFSGYESYFIQAVIHKLESKV